MLERIVERPRHFRNPALSVFVNRLCRWHPIVELI
jgi:hypothetical protein